MIVPPPSGRPVSNPNAITPPEFVPLSRSLAAPPALSKDSVELLLEGMAGPRPDRRKTTPQSDGEASAAYHAEHGLRPARSSSEPGPKVVVERPAPSSPRSPRPVTTIPDRASAGSREALSTFVPGRVLRRRAAMAILTGVLIVLLSFMAMRLTEKRSGLPGPITPQATTAQDRPASMAVTLHDVQTPPTQAIAVEPPSSPPSPSEPQAAGPDEVPAAGPAHAGTTGSTRHHHTTGEAASPSPSGLGEFKSRF